MTVPTIENRIDPPAQDTSCDAGRCLKQAGHRFSSQALQRPGSLTQEAGPSRAVRDLPQRRPAPWISKLSQLQTMELLDTLGFAKE